MLVALLHFLWVFDKQKIDIKHYAWLGFWIGLGIAVKVNGLILILLFPFLLGYEHRDHLKNVVLIAKDGF